MVLINRYWSIPISAPRNFGVQRVHFDPFVRASDAPSSCTPGMPPSPRSSVRCVRWHRRVPPKAPVDPVDPVDPVAAVAALAGIDQSQAPACPAPRQRRQRAQACRRKKQVVLTKMSLWLQHVEEVVCVYIHISCIHVYTCSNIL